MPPLMLPNQLSLLSQAGGPIPPARPNGPGRAISPQALTNPFGTLGPAAPPSPAISPATPPGIAPPFVMTPPEMPNIDHLVLPPPIIAAPLPPVKLKKVLTNEAQRNGLIKLLSDTFKSGKVTFALGAPQGGKATYEILLDGKSVGSFTPLGEDFDNLVSVTLNKKDYDLKKDGTVTAAKTVEGIIIDDE